MTHHAKVREVDDHYLKLDELLKNRQIGEPLYFDEDQHVGVHFKNRMQRIRFFETLHLSIDVDLLR